MKNRAWLKGGPLEEARECSRFTVSSHPGQVKAKPGKSKQADRAQGQKIQSNLRVQVTKSKSRKKYRDTNWDNVKGGRGYLQLEVTQIPKAHT